MTTDADTTDVRLGRPEGRVEEQSLATNRLHESVQQLSGRVDQLSARIDRLLLAMLAIGGGALAALVGIIVTLIVQGSP